MTRRLWSSVRLITQTRSDPLPVCAPNVKDGADPGRTTSIGIRSGMEVLKPLYDPLPYVSWYEVLSTRSFISTTLSVPGTATVLTEHTLGVVLPHLPVGKKILRFCPVKLTKID